MQELFLFRDAAEALKELDLPREVCYEKGDIIYGRNNYKRALGVLLSGKAEAVARERSALSTFHAGDAFGAAALFGGEEYISFIRALAPCKVQYIPEETLQRLFREYPQTAMNYITFLSGKIRFLNGKIATYTSASVEGRLYYWLRTNCDREGHLPTGTSMTKLAKMLNVGRTSLYRAMDELERKFVLIRRNGEITLL